jgi:NADPH:quinone reductase
MATTARAWRFWRPGGPEALELAEHGLPEPGLGEALVRIRAVGLNRADLLHLAGRYFRPPPSPSFLGQEAIGEIVALGPPLPDESPVGGLELRVGERVGLMPGRVDQPGMGTYRTVGIFPQNALLPVPEGFADAEGAGFWVAAMTAVGGFAAGGLEPGGAAGKRVLVTAASSGVGVTALQVARAWGATTLATTTSAAKAARLAELADHVVVVEDVETLAAELRRLTDGAGADLVFDPVGFAYVEALLDAAAVDGQVVIYGLLAGSEAPFDLRSLILKDVGVHGFTVYRLQRDPARLERVVAACLELAGKAALRPLLAARHPFGDAPAALAALAQNRHFGKIVLELG